MRAAVLTSCLLFACFFTACAGSQLTRLWQYNKTRFNYYSLKDDIEIGEHFMKKQIEEFEKKNLAVDPPEHSQLLTRLKNITDRLAKVSDMPHLPYEVHLFQKDDVANAYCLPGGKIGVFTGLFDPEKGLIDQKNDDEIAAVLAHEMAHANMRHITRRLTTYESLGFLGNIISIGASRGLGRDWGYLAGQVFSTGTLLYSPAYSRTHEREADHVGFYYMVKAGYDPNTAVAVWERASQKAKEKGKKGKTQFFSSHPASGERAAYLRGLLEDAAEVKKQQEIYRKMTE